MSEFKKRLFGKWVLSGEHSVLRSFPALVYPLSSYFMDFCYRESHTSLQIKSKGQIDLDFSLSSLFKKALKMLNKNPLDLKGSLSIDSCIPCGAGLGASSVICSGIASLFLYKGWISKKQLKPFAVSLEDVFHGKSSGMDVNVVLENKAIIYQKNQKIKPLPEFVSSPSLFLSYSGTGAFTSVAVAKVREFFKNNKMQAEQVDQNMVQSVKLCLSALSEQNQEKSNALLSQGLSLGEKCFQAWGLISGDLDRHIEFLKNKGALAVKPTGSGLGGYVISLWLKEPPLSLKQDLIPVNV